MAKNIETLKVLLPPDEIVRLLPQIPEGQTPLWEHWEAFVVKYLRAGRSLSTVNSVRDFLKLLMRETYICSIEQCLDQDAFEDELYRLKEKRNVGDTTFNTYLKNIKTYFIWLERKEIIEENKLKRIMKKSETRGKQLTSTAEQVKLATMQIMERRQTSIERKRNLLFFGLLKFTGARPIELERMKVGDIYATKNGYQVIIHGAKQNSDPRYYRLPSWLRDLYLNYITHRNQLRPNEENFFISQSKTTGWTRKGMRKLMTNLSKEIGFRITHYSVRRYVATSLNASGVELEKISNYLGHKRHTTTKKYIEESCVLTNAAGDVMSKLANL